MPCGPRRPTARQSAVVIPLPPREQSSQPNTQAGEFIDHFSVDLLSGASHNALQPYEKRSLLPTFILYLSSLSAAVTQVSALPFEHMNLTPRHASLGFAPGFGWSLALPNHLRGSYWLVLCENHSTPNRRPSPFTNPVWSTGSKSDDPRRLPTWALRALF